MKRASLRQLGIGFLSAGILTGIFATFVQGQSPIPGIQLSAMFGQDASLKEQVASQEVAISELESERDSLLAEQKNKQRQNKEAEGLESQIASLQRLNASLLRQTGQEVDETDENNAQENPEIAAHEGEPAQGNPDVSGSFTVESGSSSQAIAEQLQNEGYIQSAEEFQALLDQYGLHGSIQAGSFDLNSDMTIHDIASILTQGAYYYTN